jgi:glycosyltransferase involved in cell wall biosynthesis
MAEIDAGLSVILPVFNDGPRAARCLDSIRRMEPPGCPVEIIVVDNGSTDRSREQLAAIEGIILLDEKRRGSYSARNRGAEAAAGAILAFTDSDCEVEPGWGRAAVRALAQSSADAVQGHTMGLAGRSVWSQYCGRQYAETICRMAEADNLDRADTRNFAVRAKTFRRLGGFRTEWLHAADWEFGARLHHQGCRTVSTPAMRVRHHDPENLDEILGTRGRQAASMASMCDTIPWLGESGYLAPANRWYHGGRRVPLLRWILGATLTLALRSTAAWLKLFHSSRPSPVGYGIFKTAGTLAGAAGLYWPARPTGADTKG